jgi:hypothetical protein
MYCNVLEVNLQQKVEICSFKSKSWSNTNCHEIRQPWYIFKKISASCLVDAAQVKVIAGDIDLTEKSKDNSPTRVTMTAKQWKIHDAYFQKTAANDIALIQLPGRIPYTVKTDIVHVHPGGYTDANNFSGRKFRGVAYLQNDSESPLLMKYEDVKLTKCSRNEEFRNRFCVSSAHLTLKVPHFYIRHYLCQGWSTQISLWADTVGMHRYARTSSNLFWSTPFRFIFAKIPY